MSDVRVHNFSISLDGFATGEGLAADAPFGHAGHRLHEWMFATRFWQEEMGGGLDRRRLRPVSDTGRQRPAKCSIDPLYQGRSRCEP